MVICKFFLSNSCKYGDSCRFSHSYHTTQNYNNSPYSYRAPEYHNNNHNQNFNNPPNSTSSSKILEAVVADTAELLKHGQWYLSTYSPVRGGKYNLPGFIDISPEETRYFYTYGVANGRSAEFKSILQNCCIEVKRKYESLLTPNNVVSKVLRDLESGASPTQSFPLTKSEVVFFQHLDNIFRSNINANQDSASMLFANAAQNIGTSNNTAFGQNTLNDNIMLEDQPAAEDKAAMIFANAAQSNGAASIPNMNIFETRPPGEDRAAMLFANAAQSITTSNNNPFLSNNPFVNNNVFENRPQTENQFNNVFKENDNNQFTMDNVFGSRFPFENDSNTASKMSAIYSALEDISSPQQLAFQENKFQHGFIPEIAPTRELSLC